MRDELDHVMWRRDRKCYFYIRRVPKDVAHLDTRTTIKRSLGTDDVVEAGVKARDITRALEDLWQTLRQGGAAEASWRRYEAAVALARSYSITYRPAAELVGGDLALALDRMRQAEGKLEQPLAVEAITGTAPAPSVTLGQLWRFYEEHKGHELAAKSPRQMKQHKNHRLRAIEYAKELLGDMELGAVTRADVLRFRSWWAEKMVAEGLTAETANRSFSDLRGMITTVDEALATDYSAVWTKLRIKPTAQHRAKTRPPYPVKFVQDELLKPGVLDGLNLEARMVAYVMVETGLRLSEACNLRPEDIRLEAPVPHVAIVERTDRVQKTAHSIRTVPLVGVSLWAAKQCPAGFPRYRDKGDSLSATINKYLRDHGLRPTDDHSIYSLRHTFQDRILAAEAPDRVQADLMGHEFERQRYGEGASLEQKLELLNRIKFEWPVPHGAAPP